MNFLTGNRDIGRRLSTTERVLSGVGAAVAIVGLAAKLAPVVLDVEGVPTAGGGSLRIVSPVYHHEGRDFVIVETSVGRQGFYRSTGRSSGMPGTWLPFDEIFEHDLRYSKGWFNKGEYVRPGDSRLHRFGSEEFKAISETLTSRNIPTSTFVLQDEAHVNQMLDFFGTRTTSNSIFRPTPDFRAPAAPTGQVRRRQ